MRIPGKIHFRAIEILVKLHRPPPETVSFVLFFSVIYDRNRAISFSCLDAHIRPAAPAPITITLFHQTLPGNPINELYHVFFRIQISSFSFFSAFALTSCKITTISVLTFSSFLIKSAYNQLQHQIRYMSRSK